MRALDFREQARLMRLCRKLTAENVMKFISELTHLDEWEEDEEAARAREAKALSAAPRQRPQPQKQRAPEEPPPATDSQPR